MIITILIIVVLIFSAILHEYAHGWMAKRLGDDTAEREGRLTLNPIPHLDWFGSILLPLILIITKANFFLAWAKPVPYNPYNLHDRKYGDLKVALAGPATNFILAIIFGLIIRFLPLASAAKTQVIMNFLTGNNNEFITLVSGSLVASLVALGAIVCIINLMLGIFNLIPIPPLDGSKILFTILPERGKEFLYRFEQYGLILLLILLMTPLFDFVFYGVLWAFTLLAGV